MTAVCSSSVQLFDGRNFLLIMHSHNSSACWGCVTPQSNCSCLNLTDPLCYCLLCLYDILTNSHPRPPCGRSRFSAFSMSYLPVCNISGPEWCKGKGKQGGSLSVPPADRRNVSYSTAGPESRAWEIKSGMWTRKKTLGNIVWDGGGKDSLGPWRIMGIGEVAKDKG